MKNVIQFAHQRPDQGPMIKNYAGRILALNPEKARTFQCGGFHLTPSRMSAVVPEEAQMAPIHLALLAGRLIDVTVTGEIKTSNSSLGLVGDQGETGKKAYFTKSEGHGLICLQTDNLEEQKALDEQIEAGAHKLVLPPGYEDQEKYLIRLAPVAEAELPAEDFKAGKREMSDTDRAIRDQYRKLKAGTTWWGRIKEAFRQTRIWWNK
jgi:hypothetical protein